MIRQRVNPGLSAIRTKIKRDGHFSTKAGIVPRRLVCQVRPTQIVNRGNGRKQSAIENCAPPACGLSMASPIQ